MANLKRHGLPGCACGSRFMPGRIELAELLDVDCAARDEYDAELASVRHGQAPHGIRGRQLRQAEQVAYERVERRRRERARSNRLQAIMPPPDPMPF